MSIKITDLTPELQELVHERQIDQGNDGTFIGNLENGKMDNNFTWDETPEGDNFWYDVSMGRNVTHYSCYPTSVSNIVNNFPIH